MRAGPPSRMTLLADLVNVSARVAGLSGRHAKIAALADFLRGLAPAEAAIGVAYLAGETPQGGGGIGYALLRAAQPDAAATVAALTLTNVDAELASVVAA